MYNQLQSKFHARFANVDAMRGLAVLLVVWMHTTEVFVGAGSGVAKPDGWLFDIASTVDFGRIGVVLFFFISGFVIPSSLVGDRSTGAFKFIVRRFFRLYPAYWFSILPALVVTWWAFDRPIELWQIAANLTMLQGLLGAPDIQGLYWTLGIELFFYSLCLVLFLMGVLNANIVSAGIAGVCLASFVLINALPGVPQPLRQWNAHFAFISIMFTGALWRSYVSGTATRIGKSFLVLSTLFWLVVFPLIALSFYLRKGGLELGQTRVYFSYPIATLIFVLGITHFRVTWRPLAWLGEISYSLYLLHPVAIYAIFWAGSRSPDQWLLSHPLSLYMAAVSVLSIAAAAGVYRFVEVPAIEAGKRLSSGRRRSLVPG